MQKQRRDDTYIDWPVARRLAQAAGCSAITIQNVARGKRTNSARASSAAARLVVSAYYDRNPSAPRPPDWKRPPEAPISWLLADELAVKHGCSPESVQSAARGLPPLTKDEAVAARALTLYFLDHPEARPVPLEASS